MHLQVLSTGRERERENKYIKKRNSSVEIYRLDKYRKKRARNSIYRFDKS